ncbi:UNVERIFIED_CONTAM: hypothetical protein Sradi_3660700 [Sesamum radiatum]|uniref:Uncharacterized protein n=1 Tax=Sesamum radiatum TaxID=300843 RepID=A0AAW2QJA4_SESRA
MKPPANLYTSLRLAGQVVALRKFISRSAERSLPFFKTLRKTKNFVWDKKCQQAFYDLKVYLVELPLLTKPTPGELLYLYLVASNNETKYEALIADIRMALNAGAKNLMPSAGEVKEDRMNEYLKELDDLTS